MSDWRLAVRLANTACMSRGCVQRVLKTVIFVNICLLEDC